MSGCLIGSDIGSSSTKTILVDPDSGVIGVAEHPYPMHRPQPSWAENDPEDWYRAVVAGVHDVLAASSVKPRDVAAICIVGQRDPVALVDDSGFAVTPAIHWTDRRDAEETDRLFAELGPARLSRVSGLAPLFGLTLPNLVWTKRHLPEKWSRARRALAPKDYVINRLTGEAATDITTPTRSLLSDWRTWDWSPELCADAGIPLELMPPVRYRPWEPRARLSGAAAEVLGLSPGTILAAGSGDDNSATLGCGVIDVGAISVGTGSSSSWRLVTEQSAADPRGVIGLCPHVLPNRYIYETVVVSTGTSFRWFRDAFGRSMAAPGTQADYAELIAEAEQVQPGADGLLFYPYIDGSSLPYACDDARAVFFGILPGHGRGHFVRAILEGIAFNYPPVVDLLGSYVPEIGSLTIVDGEARSRLWNTLKADVMGREVRTTGTQEAAGLGAAILAGLASGQFATGREGVDALVTSGEVFTPDQARHDRYVEIRQRWEAVRPHVFAAFAEAPRRAIWESSRTRVTQS